MIVDRPRRARLNDAAMRQAIDEAKARYALSDVIGRRTKLRRAGRELVGLCPFHQERTPSLHVNDGTGLWHCFGCGAAGDVVQFIMKAGGIRFMDALRWLGAADLPPADQAAMTRAREWDAAARAAAIDEARAVWEAAVPAAGTTAAAYARSRGITAPLPTSIRFGRTYAWRDRETGETGPDLPAMIGAIVDGAGELIGVQRIFIAPDGSAKARMRKPKRTLGRVLGGTLRLGPPASELIVCEGPEDGLTLAQELPGRSVWVTLGTAMMPAVEYPPEVSSIVLAGDNDPAGQAAVMKAAEALSARGYATRLMFPRVNFKDFNDQLRGVRA